jgi:hypothetical protein
MIPMSAKEIKKQIKNEIPPRAGFLMLDHRISSHS